MGMLAKLIKAVVSAVLLNKAARNAFIIAITKSAKFAFRPSTISKVTSFFSGLARAATGGGRSNLFGSLLKGLAELMLLRFAKKGGLAGAGALSALAAVLLAMMRGREKGSTGSTAPGNEKQKGQIIDLDEYTILEDRH